MTKDNLDSSLENNQEQSSVPEPVFQESVSNIPKTNIPENNIPEIGESEVSYNPIDNILIPEPSYTKTFFTYSETRYNEKKHKVETKRGLRTWILFIFVILAGFFLNVGLRAYVYEPFLIPSESMENTLLVGDKILVEKITTEFGTPKRGDIVVFKDPDHWLPDVPVEDTYTIGPVDFKPFLQLIGFVPADGEQYLVKRLIGLPGDNVTCNLDGLPLKVNGVPILEPYIKDNARASESEFNVLVPPGKMWVMGDNRPASADSRFHMDESTRGFVPLDDIVGVYFVTIGPFERMHFNTSYNYIFDRVPDRS